MEKFLFFDIECANCYNDQGKVCEFGYVMTDQDFNVLDNNEIIINPVAEFDNYVIRKLLAYPENIYLTKPEFDKCYNDIKHLFDTPDVKVVGHTIDRDAHYLNGETERYNLPYLNYKFFDAKHMFADCFEKGKSIGLNDICEFFGLEKAVHAHRACDDAFTTMKIVREMCKRLKTDFEGLVNSSENCTGYTENGQVHTVEIDRNNLIKSEKQRIGICLSSSDFKRYVNSVTVENDVIESELNGKTLTITNNYQKDNYSRMGIIVKLLKERNCTYTFIVNECDILVSKEMTDENGKVLPCSKLKRAKKEIQKGKEIRIIDFYEFLNMLGLTEEELNERAEKVKKEWQETERNLIEQGIIKQETDKTKLQGNDEASESEPSMAEILKSKGIDLNKLTH